MRKYLEKLLDRLVALYMLKRWNRVHSAIISYDDFIIRIYSKKFYDGIFPVYEKAARIIMAFDERATDEQTAEKEKL